LASQDRRHLFGNPLIPPEGPPAVERHYSGEILELLALLRADVGDVLGAGDAELVGVLVVHHQVGQQGDHVHREGQALLSRQIHGCN
jgi:hypothetical protein